MPPCHSSRITYHASPPTPADLLEHFRFLVVRAIQRSGLSYKRQRRACDAIDTALPPAIRPDIEQHALEIAAHCLQTTRPRYYVPRPKRPKETPPTPSTPSRPPRLPSPAVLAREAAVFDLREREHLHFREISRRLALRGPGLACTIYAKACRRRGRPYTPILSEMLALQCLPHSAPPQLGSRTSPPPVPATAQ